MVDMSAGMCMTSDVCVQVYSTTDQKSFDHLSILKQKLLEHVRSVNGVFPFVLVGTKTDLVSERVVEKETAQQWCTDHDSLDYFEVSAKDDVGVDEAIDHIARLALKFNTVKQKELEKTSKVALTASVDDQPVQRGCY